MDDLQHQHQHQHLTLAHRSAALAERFTLIAATRMQGMPLLNPALVVEVVGFEPWPAGPDLASEDAAFGLGILITPWFMNLVRLPLQCQPSPDRVGLKQGHVLAGQTFEFIVAHELGLGAFEACSLFSPMFEFSQPEVARDTARHILACLRTPVPALPQPVAGPAVVPARRAFLLGRRSSVEHAA